MLKFKLIKNKYIVFGVLGFLLVIILIGIFSKDLLYFKHRTIQIVHNFDTKVNYSNNIVIKVNKIEPINGNCHFDIIYKTYDSTLIDKNIKMVINEGNVIVFNGGSTSEYNNILSRTIVDFDKPKIFKASNATEIVFEQKDIEVNLSDCARGFFYPFDSYKLRFSIGLFKNNVSLGPSLINFLSNESSLIHTRPISIVSYGRSANVIDNSIYVVFYRPLYLQALSVLTVIFLITITLWQFITIIRNKKFEMIAFIGLNISLIFGVMGLRRILVPENLDFAPVLDFSFLMVWILTFLNIILIISKQIKSETDFNK